MIRINLLPWRENSLKQRRRVIFLQLMLAVSVPVILSAAIWLYHQSIIEAKMSELAHFNSTSGQKLNDVIQYELSNSPNGEQPDRFNRINKFLTRRFAIPELLVMLQRQPYNIDIHSLSISQLAFQLTATGPSTGAALSLLNHVRRESRFCEVNLKPNDSVPASVSEKFELQARFCHE